MVQKRRKTVLSAFITETQRETARTWVRRAPAHTVRIGAAAALITGSGLTILGLQAAAAESSSSVYEDPAVQRALANLELPDSLDAYEDESQFQVNTYTTNEQEFPAVAMDSEGNFVVVWQSEGSADNDVSSTSIQGQLYDSSGAKQGAQFQVNSYTTGIQADP